MNPPKAFKVMPPGEGRTLMVAGGRYTLKATNEDTEGAFALIEMVLPPQSGPPPHLHSREDEAFYVLEGEIRFQVGDQSLTAGAGAFVLAPRGIAHTFKNEQTTPARMLMWVTPAGLEKFFLEIGQPAEASPGAPLSPGLDRVQAIAPSYGLTVMGGEYGAQRRTRAFFL